MTDSQLQNLFWIESYQIDLTAILALALILSLGSWSRWLHRAAYGGIRPILFLFLSYGVIQSIAVFRLTERVWASYRAELLHITPAISLDLKDEGHDKLTFDTDQNSPIYQKLIEFQKLILQAYPDVSDIYTLGKKPDGSFAFLVDSETDYDRDNSFDHDREMRTPIGEPYDNLSVELNTAWRGDTAFTEVPYTDKWGYWVSIFSPLKKDNGEVYAILGLDFSAKRLVLEITKVRTTTLAIGVTFYLLSLCLWALNVRVLAAAEERATLATQMAEQSKLAELGTMAAGIAHEINNPLAVIVGKAHQLLSYNQSGGITPDLIERHAQSIVSTSERITKIVKSLKTISRDGSRDPLKAVQIASLIDDGMTICQDRFKSGQVDLKVGTISSSSVDARPSQVVQVLINLLNNAFDAVQANPERWVKIETEDQSERHRIKVIDSGNGIPDDVAGKIMSPFFTTKPVGKGTGLGLSISRKLIRDQGGDLYLDRSCPNTCFVIELPKKAA